MKTTAADLRTELFEVWDVPKPHKKVRSRPVTALFEATRKAIDEKVAKRHNWGGDGS